MMGWKKETLAGFARVSLSTIERIERGEAVSAESLDRVAEALRQPPGAFTALRIPSTSEEALKRLEESSAPFAETVAVPVKPLRGHRQIAELGRSDLIIVDGSRLGDAYDPDIDTLREWLDLTSFILATEVKDSIIRTDADPVKRRKLYDDVLTCVRNIERRDSAIALAGTYQVETGNTAMPEATAALVGFFPKLTDPAAINRQTLFAPARVDWPTPGPNSVRKAVNLVAAALKDHGSKKPSRMGNPTRLERHFGGSRARVRWALVYGMGG